jgi:hypothetical protein
MARLRRISVDAAIVRNLAEVFTMPKQRRARKHSGNSEKPDFDVEAFIDKLDSMGMKLTAIPLADGKLRVSRWCMMKANEHAQQIRDLWTGQIGDDQERIDVLAAHLAKAAPRDTACISSGLPHVASQSIAAPDAATE